MRLCSFLFATILCCMSKFQSTSSTYLPILWPQNGEWGFFVAIAIPLDLPHRSVFVSYNFEANYYLLYNATTIIPGPLTRLGIQRDFPQDAKTVGTNSTQISTKSKVTENEVDSNVKSKQPKKTPRKKVVAKKVDQTKNDNKRDLNEELQSHRKVVRMTKTPFVTRKGFYKILRTHMTKAGYNGRNCLLRMICESAADPLGLHNGIFGDIIHIVLTPSSSKDEKLHKDYYIAESMGAHDDCSTYEKMCPESVLDLITQVTEDFMQ